MKNNSRFSLFSSHLDLAHGYWKQLLRKDDTVIDATCGNGKDTLVLAQLVPEGHLFAIDIQCAALENTKKLLTAHLPPSTLERVTFCHQSHATFPTPGPVRLIVYNLGYLPGSDKTKTTTTESTLESLYNALTIIDLGGAISITTYPGHPEGAREHAHCLEFLSSLKSDTWSVCHHIWRNAALSPNLFVVQKSLLKKDF